MKPATGQLTDRPARQAARPAWRRALWKLVVLLAVLVVASLALGSRPVPPAEVLRALLAPDPANDLHLIVRELRLPRTALALGAGAALGLAGAIMQAVTRNPLAEPGLLGLNAGAAIAIVLGAAALRLETIGEYVWLGMAGAGLAGAFVFLLGRGHAAGNDPVRLVLAGAGLSIVLGALTGIVILNAPLEVLDLFRGWSAGSLEGRGMEVAVAVALALLAGGGLALVIAPGLNALALGQDLGRALGLPAGRTLTLACLAVMILAGTATAAAGPIGFVGLVAPHVARTLAGPDQRRVLPLSALFAAAMLLLADILGRVIAGPQEVAAGIVATLLGGPVFIHIVRRFRMVRL